MPARSARDAPQYENVEIPAAIRRYTDRAVSRLLSFCPKDFVSTQLLKPATHLLNRNAKFLRAMLVFTGADALGEEPDSFTDLAVALELLHTSSLIHDDIIDRDLKRRGVSAVHIEYDRETAILAGDALMAKAVELSSSYGREVITLISKSAMRMCAGELLDYDCQKGRRIPSLEEYLDIAQLKCASLIGASCSAPALYKRSAICGRMDAIGTNIGMAYQIRDDALDFAETGRKRAVTDFKPNIVAVLHAHSGMGIGDAVARAARFNNGYVDAAEKQARDRRLRAAFWPYLNFVGMAAKA